MFQRQYSSHSIWHKPMGTITVTGSTSVSVCNGWVRSRSLDQHTCRWHLASGVPPDRIQDEARTPRAWAASTSSIPRHRFMDKPSLCNGLALLAGASILGRASRASVVASNINWSPMCKEFAKSLLQMQHNFPLGCNLRFSMFFPDFQLAESIRPLQSEPGLRILGYVELRIVQGLSFRKSYI